MTKLMIAALVACISIAASVAQGATKRCTAVEPSSATAQAAPKESGSMWKSGTSTEKNWWWCAGIGHSLVFFMWAEPWHGRMDGGGDGGIRSAPDEPRDP